MRTRRTVKREQEFQDTPIEAVEEEQEHHSNLLKFDLEENIKVRASLNLGS